MIMDLVKIRINSDEENTLRFREAISQAMQEFGLDITEKGLPKRWHDGSYVVYLTAVLPTEEELITADAQA